MNAKNLTLNEILEQILKERETNSISEYIILGKSGPTGKTWLWDQLRKNGLNATELSEWLIGLVSYGDNDNHYIGPILGNKALIVLNRPLDLTDPRKNHGVL